ncbi:MAG: hypothetical protein RI955_1322 [Bacteroidota bacterium]|jgi:hypothetical protein
MILYNVTVKIDPIIENEWLTWMQQTHIPDVMNTGFFDSFRICKLDAIDETENEPTYVFQYTCSSREKLNNYFEHYAPKLRDDVYKAFGDKFFAFRTTMEVLNEAKNNI